VPGGAKVSGWLRAPVVQIYTVAQGWDPLVMSEVASDQRQAVPQRDGGDHGIGTADRLPDAFQIRIDPPRERRASLVQGQQLDAGQPAHKLLDAIFALELVETLDDLEDGDDGDSVMTVGARYWVALATTF